MNVNTTKTSKQTLILDALLAGDKLTHLKALAYGTHRLAAYVFNLRKAGYNIVSTVKRDGNGTKFTEYSLAS